MPDTKAYAVHDAHSPLVPYNLHRRDPGDDDVVIEIKYCGICHTDIHQVRNEWGNSCYPMVPGHEIIGLVTAVGAKVKSFAIGDRVGVGCFVDSCRICSPCLSGQQSYCEAGPSKTYNGFEQDKKTPTQGGYAKQIVVQQDFVLRIPFTLDLAAAAPLLCAGITTYSPLRYWQVGPGKRVGVIGLGGLGHMAIQLAHAFGAEVTLFTSSQNKIKDGKALGADHVVLTSKPWDKALTNYFDLILDTVSASHDIIPYLELMRMDGVFCFLGVPPAPAVVSQGLLIGKRLKLTGSLVGGLAETQEMLVFCAEHKVLPHIELINIKQVNEAYDRVLAQDVKYRFVIDMESLAH